MRIDAAQDFEFCTNEIRRILSAQGASEEETSRALFDALRYAYTIAYLRHHGLVRGKVLEVGSPEYLSSMIVSSAFSDTHSWQRFNTTSDLRYEPLPFGDSSMDAAICLEVIEHLSDLQYQEATTLSGLFAFGDELFRVIRPGGKALITTPNASSVWTIQRALLHQVPMMYDWHFREFTVDEMRRIMEFIGFEVVTIATEFVWHNWDFTPLSSL